MDVGQLNVPVIKASWEIFFGHYSTIQITVQRQVFIMSLAATSLVGHMVVMYVLKNAVS